MKIFERIDILLIDDIEPQKIKYVTFSIKSYLQTEQVHNLKSYLSFLVMHGVIEIELN